MRLRRIETGHYVTPCGRFEAYKVDDGVRSHGGPVWLLGRGFALKRTVLGKAFSFREARAKLAKMVDAANRADRGALR